MPFITFEPTGTGAGWTFSLDGEPPKGIDWPTYEIVGWAVRTKPDQTVRLSTGQKLGDIPGRVSVRIGDATPHGMVRYSEGEPMRWGGLHYHEAVESGDGLMGSPESYGIDLYVSGSLFERIRALLTLGKIPSLDVWVGSGRTFRPDDFEGSDKEAVQYGWEPDGSGLEWDNAEHPHLQVRWCRFDVDVGTPGSPEDENLPDPDRSPPTKADAVGVLEAIQEATARIEQVGRRLLPVLWICVALLAVLVFRR